MEVMGFGKYEFFDVDDMWVTWGAKNIEAGIHVEEKVDGRRFQIHADRESGKIKFYTEDRKRDRSDQFPEIVDEIWKLKFKKNVILDAEMLAFEFPPDKIPKNARAKREVGKLMPREDTAAITVGKVPEELRKRLVLTVYDIFYLDDEPLVDKPYTERRKIYTSLIPRNLQYIDYVRGDIATTQKQFYQLVEKYRRVNGSEGVVLKRSDFTVPVKYSGENRSEAMAKLKNMKEIDVMVWNVVQKKKKTGEPLPQYMYDCVFEIRPSDVKDWYPQDVVEWKGKVYAKIGRTYATATKCKRGDIITVVVIRVREYEKDGKKRVTWMFPIFVEKRTDKKEPDTITTVNRLIKIGTGPSPEKKSLEKMSDEELEEYLSTPNVVIRLRLCPYYKDPRICPMCLRFGYYPRYKELSKKALVEVLKYPIECILAWYYRCYYCKGYYYGFKEVTLEDKLIEENVPY